MFYAEEIQTKNIQFQLGTNDVKILCTFIPNSGLLFLFKFEKNESYFLKLHINQINYLCQQAEWIKIPYNINVYSQYHCVLLGYQYVIYILSWKCEPIFYNIRSGEWIQADTMFDTKLRMNQMSWVNSPTNKLYYFSSCCDNQDNWNINKNNYGYDINEFLPIELKREIIDNYKMDGEYIVFGFCRSQENTNNINIPEVIKQQICNFYYKAKELNTNKLNLDITESISSGSESSTDDDDDLNTDFEGF